MLTSRHGPWTLVGADAVGGKTLTSWPNLQTDVRDAGGTCRAVQVSTCAEGAYTLVTSMTTADRQAHQRELLDTYRKALAASGGPDLEPEHLWRRYRQAGAYAYVAATVTAGLGGMQAADIALAGLQRAVAALNDLETVAALREVS